MKKTGISGPHYIGKLLKLNNDSFIEGSSDNLLSVNVKFLLNFEEVNVVQDGHGKQAFY